MQRVYSLLVDNNSGVLSRISGLFTRRGYNIDSITAGVTADSRFTRITIVSSGDEIILSQIEKQIAKLQKRAARHGAALQGADAAALADAAENLQTAQPASAQAEQAVGELLFAAANLARQAGVDPEQALQKANEAFCTAAGPVA